MTGIRLFEPWNPDPEFINLEDIAYWLSITCRWRGRRLRRFYSVAEHSVRVALLLELRFTSAPPLPSLPPLNGYAARDIVPALGLLHDAAEAYLGDLPDPVKRRLPEYRDLEDHLLSVIYGRFGLLPPGAPLRAIPVPYRRLIDEADETLAATEARDLFTPPLPVSGVPLPPPQVIRPVKPKCARTVFLAAAGHLGILR